MPAVVLLTACSDEAERWLGKACAVRKLPQAKFTAPLLPEQDAQLELRLEGKELRFSLTRDADSVATQGRFATGPTT